MILGSTVGRPVYQLYKWLWASLDLLFPPKCGGCGRSGERWCKTCQGETALVSPPVCERCGKWIVTGKKCHRCLTIPPKFKSLRSWAIYKGPLRKAVLRLKYAGDMSLGDALARPLMHKLGELSWRLDIVVPVPMGAARVAERGYNQAALLALPVALGSGVVYRPKAMKKVRDIRSQVGLSVIERYENVNGAFQADENLVKDKIVLVIDDVITSGATVNACTDALLKAGAKEVYGLTVARAGTKQVLSE